MLGFTLDSNGNQFFYDMVLEDNGTIFFSNHESQSEYVIWGTVPSEVPSGATVHNDVALVVFGDTIWNNLSNMVAFLSKRSVNEGES